MFQIVIDNTYYKSNSWFDKFNARIKKDSVYLYDYDNFIGFILNELSYSELQRFRLNIYNYLNCNKLIKFTNFRESDLNGGYFEGIKISSDIIDLDSSVFCDLLPNKDLRKKFFVWDDIREKWFYKSEFINYIKLYVI